MFMEGLGLEANERANKAALLLAHERYSTQFEAFVKKQASRFSYVEPQVEALLEQCAEETGADYEYVKDRFGLYITQVLGAASEIPAESTGLKNDTPSDMGEFTKTDVMDRGEVPGLGLDEALNGGVDKEELGSNPGLDPTFGKCARCEADLSEKIASETDVCAKCTRELIAKTKEGDASWNQDGMGSSQPAGTGTGLGDPSQQGLVQPQDPMAQYSCEICGQQGTQQDMLEHVQRDHSDVLQRMQDSGQSMQPAGQPAPGQQFPMAAGTKEADADPAAGATQPAEVQPLPESPGDRFDSIVQDLAERAAARHFSKPSDADYHALASQLGVDEQQIRENLYGYAIFGNYAGVNGELSDNAAPPDGYEAVQLQNGGNNAHQAKVPTDLVVSKVAEDMNLDDNLASQMIRDHYGGVDLPAVYNANVQGQQTFYLPSDLAGNQNQDQQAQPAQYDPTVGPAFQQTPPGAPVPAQQPSPVQPTQ